MNKSHTTEFKFDNGMFFAAHTTNGGFRVGMNAVCAIEYPAGHAERAKVEALTLETVGEFIDSQISVGNIVFI